MILTDNLSGYITYNCHTIHYNLSITKNAVFTGLAGIAGISSIRETLVYPIDECTIYIIVWIGMNILTILLGLYPGCLDAVVEAPTRG